MLFFHPYYNTYLTYIHKPCAYVFSTKPRTLYPFISLIQASSITPPPPHDQFSFSRPTVPLPLPSSAGVPSLNLGAYSSPAVRNSFESSSEQSVPPYKPYFGTICRSCAEGSLSSYPPSSSPGPTTAIPNTPLLVPVSLGDYDVKLFSPWLRDGSASR